MKMKIIIAAFFLGIFAHSQTFDIVPLGIYGGDREDNLSAYLVSRHNSNQFLCLDAGTINSGIRKSIEKKTFTVTEDVVLKDYIKAYFISHGHLDHISGMIINSPSDSKKNIYAIPFVQNIIRKHYFISDTWNNFSDEGISPIGKYHLVDLEISKTVSVPDTQLEIRAFELSHTKNYLSSAVLVTAGDESVLYLGDTGADRVEESGLLEKLWENVAPLIKSKKLKAILIEVSFPNSQPEKSLYGHLTPDLFTEELSKLATLSGQKNLKDLNIVITHRKPTGDNPEIIKKELQQKNPLQLNYIFPVQGEKLSF